MAKGAGSAKVALILCATALRAATAFGQGSPQQLTFEVASIKLSAATDDQSRFETNPGRLRLVNQTLRGCIRAAYAGGGMPLKEWQVVGGPRWVDSARYDIAAKAEGAATGAQLVQMLKALLAERFKLVVHRETQLSPGYGLVVAKGGLKIKPDPVEGEPPRAVPTRGILTYQRAPLTWLPRMLSNVVGAPIIDDAKVTGVYTFKLEWDQAELEPRPLEGDSPPGISAASAPQDAALPSLFTVLQQQLGLRLEPRKVPVDVIVVDHVETPSEID